MNLGESKHPKLQVSCPEQCVMCKGSEKSLTSLVYSRRKRSVKPGGNAENNKKQDDSLDDPGEITRKNRFDNCLVYTLKKKRGKSGCNFTGETTIMGDGLDNAFVSEHDCGETKRRANRFDNCLVYRRKKGRVNSNSCSFSEHFFGRTKISDDQAGSSAYGQREQLVKADGAFTGHSPGEIKKHGDQLSVVGSHALSVPRKYANSVSHVEQESSTLEVIDSTQVTELTCSSNGKNDSFSSLNSSSEIAAGPSKTREDEATCARVSETDTDGSCSPFKPCKHCNKPDTVENMLICDKCEELYHPSCCGIQMEEVAEIDDWFCPSCLKKNSSKTQIKGRISRERRWRVTEPFVIGIRIGKEFQADVPDWSGPTMSDTSFVGEPMKLISQNICMISRRPVMIRNHIL